MQSLQWPGFCFFIAFFRRLFFFYIYKLYKCYIVNVYVFSMTYSNCTCVNSCNVRNGFHLHIVWTNSHHLFNISFFHIYIFVICTLLPYWLIYIVTVFIFWIVIVITWLWQCLILMCIFRLLVVRWFLLIRFIVCLVLCCYCLIYIYIFYLLFNWCCSWTSVFLITVVIIIDFVALFLYIRLSRYNSFFCVVVRVIIYAISSLKINCIIKQWQNIKYQQNWHNVAILIKDMPRKYIIFNFENTEYWSKTCSFLFKLIIS